jgi:hypothetical protein
MYAIGGLMQMAYVAAFIYFMSVGYTKTMATFYLSPVGQEDSGVCEVVIKQGPNNDYIADTNGFFEGEKEFEYPKTTYNFNFNRLQVDQRLYGSIIREVQREIEEIDINAAKLNIAQNVVTWMVMKYLIKDPNEHIQTFTFFADPASLFETSSPNFALTAIQNRNISCNASRSTRFDRGSFRMITTFSYLEYKTNCNDILNVDVFEGTLYSTLNNPNLRRNENLDISFDIRTFLVSIGVSA